jgi:hypothetical protein
MSGFEHPVAGGGGNLILAAIKSPNFVHGVSGWSIDKNGSAEFQDVILPGGTGLTVTFAATAPAAPNVGDLWYNTAAGLEVSQWNGSAWVAYQIGAGALAAGIVYAGIVNATTINAATFTGSTFMGTDFVINSAGGFFYTSTPAAGNLSASIVEGSAGGTDGEGNHFLPGASAYGSTFAASLDAGFLTLYTGSQAGGWTQKATIETDSSGDLVLSCTGSIQLDSNVTLNGTLTDGGGNITGDGGPAGTPTGGPNSGTFAGHTHDFLGHYHNLT